MFLHMALRILSSIKLCSVMFLHVDVASGMLRPGACMYNSTRRSLKITEAWPMAAS